jgi:hypothetical protein
MHAAVTGTVRMRYDSSLMERLGDLIDRGRLRPEDARVNTPKVTALSDPMEMTGSAPAAYQRSVFNALLRDRTMLGIRQVNTCSAVRIDGLVDLDDGRRLALEVKYRMNWPKACQACAQIAWFKNYEPMVQYELSGGLVVFEEFSGDWARRKAKWLLENGWNYWLTDHQFAEGLPVRLLRFRDGRFESYEVALAAAEADVVL